jgi:hypothetical protein
MYLATNQTVDDMSVVNELDSQSWPDILIASSSSVVAPATPGVAGTNLMSGYLYLTKMIHPHETVSAIWRLFSTAASWAGTGLILGLGLHECDPTTSPGTIKWKATVDLSTNPTQGQAQHVLSQQVTGLNPYWFKYVSLLHINATAGGVVQPAGGRSAGSGTGANVNLANGTRQRWCYGKTGCTSLDRPAGRHSCR